MRLNLASETVPFVKVDLSHACNGIALFPWKCMKSERVSLTQNYQESIGKFGKCWKMGDVWGPTDLFWSRYILKTLMATPKPCLRRKKYK